MNSITWIKKLFGSSRKKEISKINELRPTNNDSIQIIREKLAGLQTLEYTIGKEFRWFSRTSHLQNLLKSNITLLQEKLASFENQCSTLMQQEILAQQNTRLQNNQSPLHLLNANWWLPENNVYLNKLIALTRYSTVEAIIFFNQCEPKQLNAALIKGLEISPPDFSVVVEINTLIEIGQKQLSIETPSPKNTFTAKTAFFAEGLKALSIVAEAGIQPWLKR